MSQDQLWESILTPSLQEYAYVRKIDGILQIKLRSGYTLNLDEKVIPQLIDILIDLKT